MTDIVINTGRHELDSRIKEWLGWDKNEKTRAEIIQLLEDKNYDELDARLLTRISFGTAGLRGKMMAGYACMNDLVIIQTGQGLAVYIERAVPEAKDKGVVIGFDSRHNSYRWSRLTASIFAQRGIPVYLYPEMCPTPFVPYGVLQFGCAAGIMITASHNPKDDNGYKVYWSNGAQIITPHDKGIVAAIEEHLEPWELSWNEEYAYGTKICHNPLPEVETTYYARLKQAIVYEDLVSSDSITFTFTPMHGVSQKFMVKSFEFCGLKPFVSVDEQKDPDPDFPTVKFPNPEEGKSALDLSIAAAERNGSTVILANDPDADRMAVAECQANGEWRIFTGNEIGCLLGWWLWHCYRRRNPDAPAQNCYMIASTVSSKILKSIGAKEGFNFVETLTGFKWMGNVASDLLSKGHEVLFMFEEAIGFCPSTKPLDKDGLQACMKMAELALYLKKYEGGIRLSEKLDQIYHEYGYHLSKNSYFLCYDQNIIKKIFNRLRNFTGPNTYPSSCGGFSISAVRDLTTGYDSSQSDCKAVLPSSRSSQMITFTFDNGCVATLRTSGTEPKLKYYTEMCGHPGQQCEQLFQEQERLVNSIIQEFLQPEENGLLPRPS